MENYYKYLKYKKKYIDIQNTIYFYGKGGVPNTTNTQNNQQKINSEYKFEQTEEEKKFKYIENPNDDYIYLYANIN